MFFPEWLLRFAARDMGGELLQPLIEDVAQSGLSTQRIAALQVPVGFSLVLQSASALADPGAAQNVTLMSIGLLVPDGTNFIELSMSRAVGAADVTQVLNWSGSVLVPQRWFVQSLAEFNAAVASNLTRCALVGMLIPVANTQ